MSAAAPGASLAGDPARAELVASPDLFRAPGFPVKEHGEDKPASAQTLLEVSSLCASQAEALAQVSQPSGSCLSSSPATRIWERLRRDWGGRFCIRLDLQGCFHTYPDVGGPFQILLETDEAIGRYLEDCPDPKMSLLWLHQKWRFGMKNPSSSVIYDAGHVKVGLPFGGCFAKWSDYEGDDDQYVKAREAELRHMFKGLDKPGVMKKLCTPPALGN